MDEELLKRNTDCVYFLASPLTCKKGNECEYRHSEMARLNPRDCWYWLSGSCLNPTCAFRHPPLDVHAGAVAESSHCSTPVNKTNAPCYFYFHGFCNKGDRCSFMHGPDGNAPTGKCTKTASTSSEPALENKTSARSERGSAPVEIQQCESVSEDPSESVSKYPCESVSKVPPSLHVPPREELKQPVPKNLLLQSASPPVSVCEYDDVVIRSESFIPAEGFLQGRSYDCTDQSSEEEVEDHTEHEERWDSSPGFDVLVDDKSENLGYEDDLEYLQDLDREHREPSSHLLVYDVEDSLEYDLEYHKPELRCERDICNGFDHLGDEHFFSNVKRVPGHSRHKMLDSILSSKRKLVPMGLAVGDGSSIDLREHLRRRKVIDGRQINGLSRRHGSSYLIDRSQKRPRRHGMGQRLHRRLASEVRKNTIELLEEKGTCLNGGNQYGLLKWSQQDRSKKHFRKRRLPKGHFSNEIWRKPIKRDRRSSQESTIFTGPKTLSQIKEEKQKAEENGGYNVKIGNSGRTTLADFRGPKPLSEILQDKSRLDSAGECWPLRKLTRRS